MTKLEDLLKRKDIPVDAKNIIKKNLFIQKNTKNRLLESREKYKTLFEDCPDGILIVDMLTNKFFLANPAMEKYLGYDKNEIKNLDIADIHPKEDLSYVISEFNKQLSGKKQFAKNIPLLKKNGEINYADANGTKIIINNKEYVLGFFRDTYDIKKTQEALLKSETKYKELRDTSPSGLFEIDNQGNVVYANNEMYKLTGFQKRDLETLTMFDVIHPDDLERAIEMSFKVLEGDITPGSEYRVIKKDGSILEAFINTNPIILDDGGLGLQGYMFNLFELKKAQKDARNAISHAAEQEKLALVGRIAGKMAHDFNNILGIIRMNAELGLMGNENKKMVDLLSLLISQVDRGVSMTGNLVVFAKDQEPKFSYFPINEKVDLVLNLLKKDIDEIEVSYNNMPTIKNVMADHGMTEDALVNLFQNSIHALSKVKNPKLYLKTYSNSNQIYFEIKDNGCGIPKEHIKSIYEPAFTLKGSNDSTDSYKTGIKGTGYGMINVKRFIEQHNGTINLESEINKGTKVTIGLPIINKKLSIQEIDQVSEEKVYGGKNILVVEDEQDISNVLYNVLSGKPYNHIVDIALNGQMGLNLLKRNKYDLVHLDYILPGGINGMELYEHIRNKDEKIPVMFMSGNMKFLQSIKTLKEKDNYVEHLSKPCSNMEYAKGINKLISNIINNK
jgi:two-component system, cell cycle sensor histidine kinase and response regulator CckA